MYSGTTFRTKSGRLMGVHQKIDKVAYRHIQHKLPRRHTFPTLHDILHFEGLNGPDGIKRKSPARDEPWHYIDPHNASDTAIHGMINDHIHNMTIALRNKNIQRTAFEAAWLAHAIVDGLTPAHHYPLEEKLEELRGEGLETRITTKDKLVLPGSTRRHQVRNNWEYWGAKGVMTTHLAFELGVATTIVPLRFDATMPADEMFSRMKTEAYETVYKEMLQEIAAMDMYKEFSRTGWTRNMARETRDILIPTIIQAVTLAWYKAILLAKEADERKDH
jgi:hypothetical protein